MFAISVIISLFMYYTDKKNIFWIQVNNQPMYLR